jgi:hypothetical protein
MTNNVQEEEVYEFLFKGRQMGDYYRVSCFLRSNTLDDCKLYSESIGRTRLEAFAKASAVLRGYLGGLEWHETLRLME